MGCGCGQKKAAAAAGATPREYAAGSPFAFLVERGWRPAGGGEWVKTVGTSEERARAGDAIAAELAAIEGAKVVASDTGDGGLTTVIIRIDAPRDGEEVPDAAL